MERKLPNTRRSQSVAGAAIGSRLSSGEPTCPGGFPDVEEGICVKHVVRALLACLLLATAMGVAAPRQAHAESYAEWAIRVWSVRYGLNPDYMVNVAGCESGLDPAAYNPS